MGKRFARLNRSLSLTHAAGANTVSTTADVNGLLHHAIIKAPAAVDGAATIALNIIDSDNVTIYSKSGIAAAATSNNLLPADARVPLSGTYTIQVVFSANQTVTDTVTQVILLIDKGF